MTSQAEFVKGDGFTAEVIRTGRSKTATVKVREGNVSVVVPQRIPLAKVELLVTQKTRWIKEKLLLQKQHPTPKPKKFVNGERFTYLGRSYRLNVIPGPKKTVKLKNGCLVVEVPPSQKKRDISIRDALVGWYREHALDKLRLKVAHYAEIVGASPSSVNIKTFKGRWGSCSTNGRIVFNWQIILAPDRIVDYAVIHELCHLHEHNHSPRYWKHVERVYPEYRDCRRWLRLMGPTLKLS